MDSLENKKDGESKIQIQQTINQNIEEFTAYSLFLYAFRSPISKDCYLRRMKECIQILYQYILENQIGTKNEGKEFIQHI